MASSEGNPADPSSNLNKELVVDSKKPDPANKSLETLPSSVYSPSPQPVDQATQHTDPTSGSEPSQITKDVPLIPTVGEIIATCDTEDTVVLTELDQRLRHHGSSENERREAVLQLQKWRKDAREQEARRMEEGDDM
ncbi:predicted protein [Plenodomus lingam JN3]|uniref:Predicted protein n=2 Tax=Leptosphaeria maculans TaxID=5022 RepID=E4ZWS8_LEPMJ|nr:predicted protein [Plenodomus lingam JN3]CBX96054.1 predicted protein [Plenodomus lingam JN3]